VEVIATRAFLASTCASTENIRELISPEIVEMTPWLATALAWLAETVTKEDMLRRAH
jgi:hypothetical protein